MYRMKKKALILGTIMIALLSTGCTNVAKKATENTFILNKDESVTDVSVEDYTDSNYKIDDLQDFVTDAVNDYNEKNGEDSVVLKSYEALDEKSKNIKVVIDYKSIDDYNKFNNTNYEVKSISKADLSDKFKDLEGEEVKSKAIKEETKLKVLSIDGDTKIYIKGAKYYSSKLKYNKEDKTLYNAEGKTGVIVFK